MPRRDRGHDPARIVACPICERPFPLGERVAHVAEAHPGYKLARRGWLLIVTDPAGGEASYSGTQLAALNRKAIASAREPSPIPGPDPDQPPEPGPAPTPTIDETRRPFAWQPASSPPIVTRQAIADVLSVQMLADMIRQFSATLSEWDGAGERGTFSAIESMQLASLTYDSTLGLIERYFGGNVDRFRLAVALGILLLGKGRIHLAAIAERRRAHDVAGRAASVDEALGGLAAPELAFEPEAVDDDDDEPAELPDYPSMAELVAARQAAWRREHGAAASE